ncbi:MAG: hypothetical protein IPQ13_03400 [Holophagaceae bacterium]|nr:hypothetical protein [Holophagaceae bacterium]
MQAQEADLHLDAGLATSLDRDWKSLRDTSGEAGVVTKFPLAIEGALVFPKGPGAIRAALRIAVDEPFSNLQLGADWIHTFSRKGAETVYGSAGLSLNNVKGRIQVAPPNYPDPGAYEERSQSARPGVRLGMGYAFNRNFAFECAVNYISLGSTGANGFLHSSSVYMTLTGSYRIPKILGGK